VSSESVIYVIAGCAGVLSLAAWAAWVLMPAWSAYSRLWERLLATVLSVYVLAAMVLVGAGLGAAILWYWDQV
jgi:hypothetical protein